MPDTSLMVDSPECIPCHNPVTPLCAGGAAYAAIVLALGAMGRKLHQRIAMPIYGDVDLWLDLARLTPETIAHVVGHVLRRAMQHPDAPPLIKLRAPTVLASADNQVQFCAFESNRHCCGCYGANHGSTVTPIGCFDMTAVQFGLAGRWFDPTAPADRSIALATRPALMSLFTGISHVTRYCFADREWPFNQLPPHVRISMLKGHA